MQGGFLRVDFNVPLMRTPDPGCRGIQASLPTIKYLLERGARLVVVSHLGRPKGQFNPKMSLKPVAERLCELLPGTNIIMAPEDGPRPTEGQPERGRAATSGKCHQVL